MYLNDAILNIDIKTTKELANKLLKKLQNENINFEILSSYIDNNRNKVSITFSFFTKDIDQFLSKFNDIIDTLDNKVEIRIFIPKDTKDDIKTPIRLPGDFIVCPTNYREKKYDYLPDRTILIDTGWAFGSGAHPSTVATVNEIVKLSSAVDITNYKALDIGTGTGILAIILAKLGVKSITALDIDNNAIKQATINIKINKLSNKIKLMNSPLEDLIEKDFNLVVANLTPGVLCQLIPKMIHFVIKNGFLIIASPKKTLDISCIKDNNIKKITESNIDNWYAFTYKKL